MMNTQTTTAANYNEIKNRLFLSLWNTNVLKLHLSKIPHRLIGDLAIACLIQPSGKEQKTLFFTRLMLDQYGITEEQLFEDAYLSSPKILPAVVNSLDSVVDEISEKYPDDPLNKAIKENESLRSPKDGLRISVITNDRTMMGAAAILYPGVLKKAAQGRNLFLIPSSVHEFLYFPDNGLMDVLAIEHMIQDINRTEVSIRDRLSDHLYYYDCEADEIRLAS